MGAMSIGLLTTLIEHGLPIVHAVCDDWLTYVLSQDRWAARFTGTRRRRLAGRLLRPVLGVPTAPPDLAESGVFCFVSELTRQRAVEMAPWSFARSTVVYSGIERSQFWPAPGDRPWSDRLLYVGRFDPRKGIETVLRAMPYLPATTTLVICGLGGADERDRLVRLSQELGLGDRVVFDSAPRDELVARYQAADVFVFPSEWPEPFGLVPVEAMACGTPVVATGLGGSGEFLTDHENCLLFAAGDPLSLAARSTSSATTPVCAPGSGRGECARPKTSTSTTSRTRSRPGTWRPSTASAGNRPIGSDGRAIRTGAKSGRRGAGGHARRDRQ
jgi:glycosyltransferase involved in cell wall biosynthesis